MIFFIHSSALTEHHHIPSAFLGAGDTMVNNTQNLSSCGKMAKISKPHKCFMVLSGITYLLSGNRGYAQVDSFPPPGREAPFCKAAGSSYLLILHDIALLPQRITITQSNHNLSPKLRGCQLLKLFVLTRYPSICTG
jgi:hypothetical protein